MNQKEIWKDIPEYENLYQASTLGRIRSVKNNYLIMNDYDNKHGYRSITLYKNKNKKVEKVHRLIAKTFMPNPFNKPCTNHKNGIRYDNRVENLEWVDYSENAKHGFRKLGRINPWKGKFGSEHNRSKEVRWYSSDRILLGTFGSISEAERETKIKRETIKSNYLGTHKSKMGYIWEIDDYKK